jgi:hypothetical protein
MQSFVCWLLTDSLTTDMRRDELRRQADVFTDLIELRAKIGRDPAERPVSREPRHAPARHSTAVTAPGRDEEFED